MKAETNTTAINATAIPAFPRLPKCKPPLFWAVFDVALFSRVMTLRVFLTVAKNATFLNFTLRWRACLWTNLADS
jgi:hypothetical protein